MKTKFVLLIALCFYVFPVNAQFLDDFEWTAPDCPSHWGTWGGTAQCPPQITDQAYSGEKSGYIPDNGTSDIVLDLGNRILGEWGLEFYAYIPSDREAYFNIQGSVPVGAGEWVVGNIFFNQDLASPGEGLIDDTASGEVTFSFPHDQWFRVVMNFDISSGISLATWEMKVAGETVIPEGTAFTNSSGTTATSLGGLNFFSISTNHLLYIDNMTYTSGLIIDDLNGFQDDMEYPTNEACAEWWTTWDNGTCPPIVGGNPGSKVGGISNSLIVDPVLNLGSKIFGSWGLEFDMYVPSDKEAYWSIQGILPIDTGEWVVGSVLFNEDLATPGQGVITDTALGPIVFDFPHDEWFRVAMNFELMGIGGPTWGMSVADEIVVPQGVLFTNSNGDTGTSLGGIDFSPILTNTEFFIDNFNFIEGQIPLGVNDSSGIQFTIYPNPTTHILNINSQLVVEAVKIYSIQGKLLSKANNTTLDVSQLSAGMYFLEVSSGTKKSIQKFIKR